jgi:hypothetical protein
LKNLAASYKEFSTGGGIVESLSQSGIDKRFIESEPYYMPLGNEVTVFKTAFKEKLPVMRL